MSREFEMGSRRSGRTLVAVEASKAAQRQGKTVLWGTSNQTATAELLSRHGALSEVVGDRYLKPKFKEGSG